jgi:hypothetical protein
VRACRVDEPRDDPIHRRGILGLRVFSGRPLVGGRDEVPPRPRQNVRELRFRRTRSAAVCSRGARFTGNGRTNSVGVSR